MNLKKTINSIILCIRFPFLYPRNRFTGTHYYNYNILEFRNKLYRESTTCTSGPFKLVIINYPKYWLSKLVTWFHNYPVQLIHCIPTYTELDAMPTGWRNDFGIEMCKDIRRVLINNHCLFGYRITQIKEKYGTLRWYDNMYELTSDIVNKYEHLSYNTCVVCGKPAKYRTPIEVWECPYCEDCLPKNIKKKCLTKIK